MKILNKIPSGISKASNCRNAIALITGIALATPLHAAVVLNSLDVTYANGVRLTAIFDSTTVFGDGIWSLGLSELGNVIQSINIDGSAANPDWQQVDATNWHDFPGPGNIVNDVRYDFQVTGAVGTLIPGLNTYRSFQPISTTTGAPDECLVADDLGISYGQFSGPGPSFCTGHFSGGTDVGPFGNDIPAPPTGFVFSTTAVNPVPIPAAGYLFATGLLALFHRKRTAG